MALPAYVMIGHGYENIEDERQYMPADTVLVTITECGRSVKDKELYEILDLFQDNPEIAKTPDLFPEEIRKKLRIYISGEEYPTLFLSPLSDFDSKFNKNIKLIEKSGVYPVPLPFEDTIVGEVKTTYGMFLDNSDRMINKAYEGSLIKPNIDDMEKIYGHDLPISMLSEPIPISEIFSKLGKGIYYFPICRQIQLPDKLRNLYKLIPENIDKMNSLEVAKYMYNHVDDEKLKRKLRGQIFTMETIIRPRSASKRGGARSTTRQRRNKRRTYKRVKHVQ